MKRRFLAVLAFGLLLGAAGAGDDTVVNEIKQQQDKLNIAFRDNDEVVIKRLIASDHLAVTSYYDRPLAFDAQIKALGDSTVTEYSAGTMNFNRLADNVVQVTYNAMVKGTYRGKPIPSKVFVSALWVRRNGQWQESFYQETPLGAL